MLSVELEDVVNLLKMLLNPIVESITGNKDYSAKWDHESRSWKAIRGKENRIDQAIFEAEQEFAETGEAVDADVAFSELEKKFVGLNE